jgi:hypothetical protein
MTNCVNFPDNPGFLLVKLSDEQLAPIWAEVNKIQQDWSKAVPHNTMLAGNIRKEYVLSDCRDHVAQVTGPYLQEYLSTFKYDRVLAMLTASRPLLIHPRDLWVNFQQKHEFNPPHDHSGVMSFVIWLKIPFEFKDECLAGPGSESHYPVSGDFHLQWVNSLGMIRNHSLLIDRKKEGYLCMFPSSTMHTVFPFYSSDEYRITVAGNWRLDTGE